MPIGRLGIRDVWAIRLYGIVVAFMLVLAFLFCMVNGASNSYNYLLGLNIIFSSIVGGIIARWFSTGEMAANKLWYILVFGFLLVVEAVVYDVFAFHDKSPTPSSQNDTVGSV